MARASDYHMSNDSFSTPPAPAATSQAQLQQSQQSRDGSASAQQQPGHQRTYQACIPCRRRKVRCDLGSVDNPHDPPCMRCRREAKECFFSATRRKKKTDNERDGVSEEPGEDDGYEIKTGRKRLRASTLEGEEEDPYEDVPRTPGGSIGRTQPLRRPEGPKPLQYGEEDFKMGDQMTAILQASEVHSGHDALKVLYEAAVRGRTGSSASTQRPSLNGPSPGTSFPAAMSPADRPANTSSARVSSLTGGDMKRKAKVESPDNDTTIPPDPVHVAAALKAWQRYRFVRQGWFTAKEGMAYVEYFYKYCAPLTPVALPDFRPPEHHPKLLATEPMLSVTILLTASRHMELEGPGSQSRPYVIHNKLWTYLQGMVDRLVWGQEQFGGGFCGAGAEPSSDVNPLSRKGLRTLGTAESLILLTEWHPRAMHFPPDEDDDDLMTPECAAATPDPETADDVPKGIGGQRMDSWLEPCWRSDRLCWMLLGIAMSLAFEIGVFDKSDWQRHARTATGLPLSADELYAYDKRRAGVRDLLLVNVTLTSGRLGLTSMLPNNYSKPEDSDLWKRQLGQHDSIQDTVIHFWLRIASTLREGNAKIFANKAFTRDLIKNGDYKASLEQILAPFLEWRKDLEQCVSIPKYMRYILEIEYDYCRVYLNALALQAVAERCANEYPVQIVGQAADHVRAVTTNGVRSDVAITPQTLSKWLGGDRKYMIEVRDAACHLLSVVVDGLVPSNYLKHAPVRSYFRIISVCIMLLKSFSLGASEADIADALKLMDKTVDALRTCIVDDVHVASRFADLLDTLTQNLKPRLVRFTADGRTVLARSRRESQLGTPVFPYSQNGQDGQAYTVHQQQAGTGAGASGLSQTWNSYGSDGQQHHAGFSISNDNYDNLLSPNDNNAFSVMPPPSFGLQSPSQNPDASNHMHSGSISSATGQDANGNSYNGGSGQFPGFGDDMQDWLALPLDPLLNISGADVNQTMYGPELGGQDMLELLLAGGNNNSNGNGGHHDVGRAWHSGGS
ncbi:hypothetical protein Q7P37_001670 [Cladosporium fusiforme]